MRVFVDFQNERVDFEIPEDRLIAAWQGPGGLATSEVSRRIAHELEHPRDYPPLRQAIVPGDRVVIALGADVPEVGPILDVVCQVLEAAGVARESITVLVPQEAPAAYASATPAGVNYQIHEPDDRTELAYLATTSTDRRVYLNRLLTDADFVLPIGRLGYNPVMGYEGPWGVIFPGLSDTETRRKYLASGSYAVPDRTKPGRLLEESAEVGWLLGCQFQVGIVIGVTGLLAAVAGLGKAVFEQGAREVDDAWTVRAETRAELVIAGIGRQGESTQIDDVARGLATASRLVQRGGKIVVLSRAEGELGPALQRLIGLGDPRVGPSALRGHESDRDFAVARQVAQAPDLADVYLLSGLGSNDVEDLSMIPLDRPEESRRLAAVSGSCLLVSHADLARAIVADEAD